MLIVGCENQVMVERGMAKLFWGPMVREFLPTRARHMWHEARLPTELVAKCDLRLSEPHVPEQVAAKRTA